MQDLQKQMLSQVKERARKLREEEDEIVRQTEFEISQVISELQLPASPLKRKNVSIYICKHLHLSAPTTHFFYHFFILQLSI